MAKPIKKDRTHLTSSEAIAKRLERVMEEDELEAAAMEKAMAPHTAENYWVKGTTKKHSEEIMRIDRTFKNRSLMTWDQKGEEVVGEQEEKKKIDKKRQEDLQKYNWGLDQEQPWDKQEEETFQAELDKWTKQTEQLMQDFGK